MQIAGNTFIVTGGASGLGAECVRRLVAAGARVLIADLNEAAAAATVSQYRDSVRFHCVNVTKTDQAQAAIDAAQREFGPIRGLVQCAGILSAARIVGKEGPHDLALFEKVVQVNLFGTFNMLRLTAAAMGQNSSDAHGERGVIINTSSVAAFEGQIGQAAYAASKGGVASLTLPAARELARFGIRVIAIAPGVFDTAMMAGADDAVRQSLIDQIPFPPRFGQPDEFAQLAQSVIENPYINGTVIRLDAAVRMGPK